MKLKRIALVCLGVFGAPALAAAQSLQVSAPTSAVEIYGRLNADIKSVEANGAASGHVVGEYETGPHNIALAYGHKGQEKLSGAGFSDLPNSFQNFGNSPITPTTLFRDPARGADPTGYGIGMIHTF
jgi:hypothetical protein